MSATGLLIGLLNIGIYVAVMLLVGVLAQWIIGWLGVTLPDLAVKLYIVIVALVALVMLVSLLLGAPVHRPIF